MKRNRSEFQNVGSLKFAKKVLMAALAEVSHDAPLLHVYQYDSDEECRIDVWRDVEHKSE